MTLKEYIDKLKGNTVDEKIIRLSRKIGYTTSAIKNWMYRNTEPKGNYLKSFFKKKKVDVWWDNKKTRQDAVKKVKITSSVESEKQKDDSDITCVEDLLNWEDSVKK